MPVHLVTGAGSGIGAAVARALFKRGDDLVLLAHSRERACEMLAEYPGARVFVADLADPASLADALDVNDFVDGLDSLVHVAGFIELNPVADMEPGGWRMTLDVNLLGPAELTRLCLPGLRANRGHLVFVNSTAGLVASPERSAYASSKFGLRALADTLRREEEAAGVRVTSVYPGRVATPMQERILEHEGRQFDPEEWIRPESVATAVLMALDVPQDSVVTDLTIRVGPH